MPADPGKLLEDAEMRGMMRVLRLCPVFEPRSLTPGSVSPRELRDTLRIKNQTACDLARLLQAMPRA